MQRSGTDYGENKVIADINEFGWHRFSVAG